MGHTSLLCGTSQSRFKLQRKDRSELFNEIRGAHSKLHCLLTDTQRDTPYWWTANLQEMPADFRTIVCYGPDIESGVDMLLKNVAAKIVHGDAQCEKVPEIDQTKLISIYNLDANMNGLIDSFADSIAMEENVPKN